MPRGNDSWDRIDALLRRRIEAELRDGETPLAWFEPDLDDRLRYAGGLVVLTAQRLLAAAPEEESNPKGALPGDSCRTWPLSAALSLAVREHVGMGRLELFDARQRLACWHYTAGRAAGAQGLADRLAEVCAGEAAEDDAAAASAACPSCGGVLEPRQRECPRCTRAAGPSPTRTLSRLAEFARPRAGMILLGFLLTLLATAASLVPPYLTMPLFDKVLVPYQNGQAVRFSLVGWCLAGLAVASIMAWLLGWARTYVLAWVSERVTADLRNRTYAHLQQLSLEFFGGRRIGDLIARIGSDSDRLCFFLSVNAVDFLSDVLTLVLTVVVLLTINPLLAVVALCPLPLIAWSVQRVRERLRRALNRAGRVWSEMTSVLADAISGIRVIKAFAQEHREMRRFRGSNDHVLSANDRVNRLWSFFGPFVVLLTDFGVLVVWGMATWLVFRHRITVGVLTAFVAYISRFYARLDSMSRMFGAAQRAANSAERIFELLDRVPGVAEPLHPVQPGRFSGEIEMHRVGFRYGNRTVLEDIDLSIAAGEMIGLVGPSGSGKTTLVNLLCRFYDVSEGAILVDGVDTRSFSLRDYRQRIGIVLQEPFLFYGTIAENIAYGRPTATRREIIEAAKAARAHEFILRQPDGYDSLVGERGQSLSGGERQRISIARALLIDPRILILDEATSSVDTETEREIQLALENLIRGRTTIAIAHRLSRLRRADRLVVVERGRIVEIGRHDELLARRGTYARLYRAQSEKDHHSRQAAHA